MGSVAQCSYHKVRVLPGTLALGFQVALQRQTFPVICPLVVLTASPVLPDPGRHPIPITSSAQVQAFILPAPSLPSPYPTFHHLILWPYSQGLQTYLLLQALPFLS